jgi:hypothetical protein
MSTSPPRDATADLAAAAEADDADRGARLHLVLAAASCIFSAIQNRLIFWKPADAQKFICTCLSQGQMADGRVCAWSMALA